ncbi:MAG: response regulator [Desulfobacteraceae bacterium]|nr:MAG: response regulator [Desulfobacteraceae bacterium]
MMRMNAPNNRFKRYAILSAMFVLLIILGAHFLLSDAFLLRHVFSPPLVLPILNMLFLGIGFLIASYLAARSYLNIGSPGLLSFGSGALVFGLNGMISGWFMESPAGVNAVVTLYNLCSLLSGLFYLSGAAMILIDKPNEKRLIRRKGKLAVGYAGVVLVVGLLIAATRYGWFPVFYTPAQGFSVFRQVIISNAILLLLISGLILWLGQLKFKSDFVFWHALALILIAEGLLGIAIARSVGGILGWTGRLAQYLGGIYLIISVVRAVRERSLDEMLAELLKPGSLHTSVFENSFDGIVVAVCEGLILSANPQASRMLGYPEAELRRMSMDDLLKGGRPAVPHFLEKTGPKERYRGELVFTRKSGTCFPADVSCSAFEDSSGKELLAFVLRDISRQKEAEAAMRYNMERYELLSSTGHELLHASEPNGVLHALCIKAMDFLGCNTFFNYMIDPVQGRLHLNAYAGIAPEQALEIEWLDYGAAICGYVAEKGSAMIAEHIGDNQDARVVLAKRLEIRAYACNPLLNVDGTAIGTLSFGARTRDAFSAEDLSLMRTITNLLAMAIVRMRHEEELRRSRADLAKANEELERKVQSRTKELTNAVQALKTTNEKLNAYSDQLRSLAGEITMAEHRERKRLAIMLHDGLQQLLAAAKLQVGYLGDQEDDDGHRRSALEVEHLLGEAIQMSRDLTAELSPPILHRGDLQDGLKWLARWMLEKHRLEVNLEAENISVLNDTIKIMLFETVRELLFNVVKHSAVQRAQVDLRKTGSDKLQIMVRDEGVGFDPAILQSPETAGRGFGLFSIRERLDLIGARMSIESSPGKGSRFTIAAPLGLTQEAKMHSVGGDFPPRKAAGRVRLLVADDHAALRASLCQMLAGEQDIEIIGEAQNGAEAVRLAQALKPHIILMDLSMPQMDGIEATRIIHRSFPEICIIGMSMYEETEHMQTMQVAGAAGYVLKSTGKGDLLKAIRACIQE